MKMLAARLILAAAISLPFTSGSMAQTYPSRPITVVIPFAGGSASDVVSRIMLQRMSKSMGQPIVVENRPGAGGNTGTAAVARATPDGYTLVGAGSGPVAANVSLYKELGYDPQKDLAIISPFAGFTIVVVASTKLPVNSLKELVAHAKANPGKLNFGSAGIGTTGHLGQELLVHVGKIKVTHVPYRGAAPAVKGLIAGQIDGTVDNPPTVLAHIQAGTITALAVAGKQRIAVLPEVPTAAEAGLPGWEASSWFGLVAPAGTPPAIVKRLHTEVAKAMKSPLMQKLSARGMRMVGDSPEEFGAFIVAERKKWGEIIKAADIKVQ
jgi:tripartite-type tricarboxylate transporter receptor subunit TctC